MCEEPLWIAERQASYTTSYISGGFWTRPDPAGYECRIGYYCPKGTTVEEPCPWETQSIMQEAR